MKEIKLTVKRQRTEWGVFVICFLFAYALNLISILLYHTEWKELYTQLGWVLALSVFVYFLLLLFRLIYHFISIRFFQKKQTKRKRA